MPKIEPAVTQLLYAVPTGTSYIDIAKDLSKVNRRLYRQGMTYVVQDVQIALPAGSRPSDIAYMQFSTTGNSYMVHNAWKKGYETWRTQQNEFMDGQGSRLKGKWADFKVYMDDAQAAGTTLEPYAADGAVYAAGEWTMSNFVYDDAGTTRSPAIHLIGTSTEDSAIGLIEAYGEARNYPTAGPSNLATIATGFYAQFNAVDGDDFNEDLGNDIRDQNDNAPYDVDAYQGGEVNADSPVPVRWIMTSASQGIGGGAGFLAPCGLIQVKNSEMALNDTIDIVSADTSVIDAPGPTSVYSEGSAPTTFVILTVAAGPYRGVLAAPMGQ